MSIFLRILSAAVLLSAAALLAGCGNGQVPVHPVTGKVLVDGEPLEGALVVFHPAEPMPDVTNPNGSVQADGTFTLTTYESGDGAPAGEYTVTVTWIPPGADAEEEGTGFLQQKETQPQPRFDPTGGRYRDEDTSPLTATVERGDNRLEPFNLEPAGR